MRVSCCPSPPELEKAKVAVAQQKEEDIWWVSILVDSRVGAVYHSVVSTCKFRGVFSSGIPQISSL